MQEFSLAHCKLFAGLNATQLQLLTPLFYEAQFKTGQIIVEEDQPATNLYIIKDGAVELSRQDHGEDFPIEVVRTGEMVGEQALLPGAVAPVTAHAIKDTDVFVANSASLNNILADEPAVQNIILRNLGLNLSHELETNSHITVSILRSHLYELNTRVKMGIFLIYAFLLLFIESFSIGFVQRLYHLTHAEPPTYITVAILFCFAAVLVVMVKHLGYPWSEFGFNLRNWKKALWEAIWWSLLFMVVITFIKWWLITHTQTFHLLSLLDYGAITRIPNFSFEQNGVWPWLLPALLYLLFIPVQVFINHSAFQSSLLHFLKGKNAVLISVLLADFLFASIHVMLNMRYAITVFIPGLLWATMYARQRSLLGVGVSHALIGIWAIWVLGVDRIVGLVTV